MAIVGSILKSASQIAHKKHKKKSDNFSSTNNLKAQKKVLQYLLATSESTLFGQKHHFNDILNSDDLMDAFRIEVPIYQYNYMFKKYLHKSLSGVENVCWPDKIENYALTSGTTNAGSKRVPVSEQTIKSIKRTSIKQFTSLSKLDLPNSFFEKNVLFVGGSTQLKRSQNIYEGDLSGIITGKVPQWLYPFTKPNKKIKEIKDWETKLDKIIENARKWDVGTICGVPSWVQILLTRIVDYYNVNSIYEIWPNLKVYIHGGVSITPYLMALNQLFEGKVTYLETYLASEGFIGYQSADSDSLQLEIDNGIYYEFIPFNSRHFDQNGELINFSDALTLSEIKEGVNYALLITTNSGLYRYMIGDTIKFTDLDQLKFKITGRTKHYLNLCGEHLSVDNMNQAINEISYENNVSIEEFAVIGEMDLSGNVKHHWYLASNSPIDALNLEYLIDDKLCLLNDDYKTERKFVLKNLEVTVLSPKVFYDFLKLKDKYGAQNKFPRVLKGHLAKDWQNYLSEINFGKMAISF
ncbi:MAG: GH3 family domain-containing protein [Putridiphycobacter sp.]